MRKNETVAENIGTEARVVCARLRDDEQHLAPVDVIVARRRPCRSHAHDRFNQIRTAFTNTVDVVCDPLAEQGVQPAAPRTHAPHESASMSAGDTIATCAASADRRDG